MELLKEQVEVRILKPSEGKQLKSIITGDVYEGEIYLGKSDLIENYIEIDKIED